MCGRTQPIFSFLGYCNKHKHQSGFTHCQSRRLITTQHFLLFLERSTKSSAPYGFSELLFDLLKNCPDWRFSRQIGGISLWKALSSDSTAQAQFYLDFMTFLVLVAAGCKQVFSWAPPSLTNLAPPLQILLGRVRLLSISAGCKRRNSPCFQSWTLPRIYMCIKIFSFLPVLKGQPSRLSQWVFTDLVTHFVMCVDKWIKIQGPR